MRFPKMIVQILAMFQIVGDFIQRIESSGIVRFMKRNKLFTLIPMGVLSYQIAVYRTENEKITQQRDFFQTRLDSYYRDWEEIQFGVWEKVKIGNRYIFLGVNDAYENNYLQPNGLREIDLIGKDNIETFGDSIGGVWRENDSLVAVTGHQYQGVEPARYGNRMGYVFISKWRKMRKNGDTTVVGMAIKLDTIQKLYIKALKNNKQ